MYVISLQSRGWMENAPLKIHLPGLSFTWIHDMWTMYMYVRTL